MVYTTEFMITGDFGVYGIVLPRFMDFPRFVFLMGKPEIDHWIWGIFLEMFKTIHMVLDEREHTSNSPKSFVCVCASKKATYPASMAVTKDTMIIMGFEGTLFSPYQWLDTKKRKFPPME